MSEYEESAIGHADDLKDKRQEIFDICANHLLTQNARSTRGGLCSYRGENGLMCAIGPLISDAEYTTSMEGSVQRLIEEVNRGRFDLDKTVFNDDNEQLLISLQGVHDFKGNLGRWPEKLKEVATRHNLEYKFGS